MKDNRTNLLAVLLFILIFSFSLNTYAQKIPGLQKNSIHAPAKVKIDGKATEWGSTLQAYNKAIQASYTVANDDRRLYLVVQTDRREIINKIINGGVSFSISKNDKKTTDGAITVTYPIFARDDRPMINFNNLSDALSDLKDVARRDSVMLNCNNSLEEKAKYIRVNNVPDVDSLISIYNLDGVKAKCGFNDKLVYTVEMSIDLKLLNVATHNLKDLNYNIRLNAVMVDYVPGVEITRDESGRVRSMNVVDARVANIYFSAGNTPTDCWGNYSLIK